MSNESTTEKQPFQAEVQQLLDIVIHSLYTDREIFVRELVSNASDALEKFRHLRQTENDIQDDDLEPGVTITTDKDAGTVTFTDTGIGMTREEIVQNLGTIAHSGTKAFVKALKENAEAKENVIGQFGVGFYSAFMVADEVEVYTRTWKKDGVDLLWKSDGKTGYTIEEVGDLKRGTQIVLKLKEEYKDFAEEFRVKSVLSNWSNFLAFPVKLNEEVIETKEAIWLKNKKDITAEQYEEFYKFIGHGGAPMTHLHFAVDAPLDIHALLFVPDKNPEPWGMGQTDPSVSLYCRKVLIDDAAKGLLPDWLRFLRGVVDSADLPLNISRESMQDSSLVQKLNKVLTKRMLKHFEKLAKDDEEAYTKFYNEFSRFIKEGVVSDYTHKDQLAKLLRYESSMTDAGKTVGIQDYLDRAKDGQDTIYFQVGASRAAIEAGPYLEGFKARGLEVLYFADPIDEYVAGNLFEFEGKKLVAVDRADVELDDTEASEGQEEPLEEAALTKLCGWMKEQFGETRVKEVRGGKRLVGSPVVALTTGQAMSPQMRQMMKQMNPEGADLPEDPVELEINARHPLVKALATASESKPEFAKVAAAQMLDNALLAAGMLEDPKDLVNRNYAVLEEALK